MIPQEIVTAFTQDQRFKQETFNDLRLAFDAVKTTMGGQVEANVDAIRGKIVEKGVEQSKQLNRAFDQLLFLVKYETGKPLRAVDFYLGVLRLEKRALLTFASRLH